MPAVDYEATHKLITEMQSVVNELYDIVGQRAYGKYKGGNLPDRDMSSIDKDCLVTIYLEKKRLLVNLIRLLP
jgi:hypothetical protein